MGGRSLHLSKQLWGPGQVQLPGTQGAACSAPGALAGCLGRDGKALGQQLLSSTVCPVGRGSQCLPETVRAQGGRERRVNGRLILGASQEACTEAAVTHRRAGLGEGAQSRKLEQGKGTLRSLGLHPVAKWTVWAFEQRSTLKRRLWWRSAGRS